MYTYVPMYIFCYANPHMYVTYKMYIHICFYAHIVVVSTAFVFSRTPKKKNRTRQICASDTTHF